MVRVAAISAALVASAKSFEPTLVPKSTSHQVMATGASGALGYAAGLGVDGALDLATAATPLNRAARFDEGPTWLRNTRRGVLLGTAAASVITGARLYRKQRSAHPRWQATPPDPWASALGGLALGAGLVGTAKAAATGLGRAGEASASSFGGPPAMWSSAFSVAAAGASLLAVRQARQALFANLAGAGRAADSAFVDPPTSRRVSGGPESAVPYDTLGREGRRFVQTLSDPARLASEMGTPAAARVPIRVFVGVDSAQDAHARVDLAMQELEHFGAFDRSVVMAMSPAGTGYANPVPAESLEQFTLGDCATVVIQYGVLPSMFSAGAVDLAADTLRLLLDRLVERLAQMPAETRPRLCLYGESLGAHAAQMGADRPDSLIQDDGTIAGVDAALFVGNPGRIGALSEKGMAQRLTHVEDGEHIPEVPPGPRTWLLDHPADPVTRFHEDLVLRRPEWLQGQRPPQVPGEMTWWPVTTWMQVALDVARATQPQLGQFQSLGHDYRADLAPAVRAAFVPEVDPTMIGPVNHILARSEMERSRKLTSGA